MPFKSKAQRRKFAQLLVEGRITGEQYEEWNRSTGGKALPEHVADLKRGKKRPAARATRKTTVRKATPRRKPATRKTTKRRG
jgi:hypothetical protein